MFASPIPYIARAGRQQEQRQQRKKASSNILNCIDIYSTSSEDDSNSSNDIRNNNPMDFDDEISCSQNAFLHSNYSKSNTAHYKPDDDDTGFNENLDDLSFGSSSPLYQNAHVSLKAAATTIMLMAVEYDFPKSVLERVLNVLKPLLPTPNLLPTTYTSFVKTIGVPPPASSKYYCNDCSQLCIIRSGKKYCDNGECGLSKQPLRNGNISEVVTLDIKAQLKTIITRNISLLGNAKLSQPFDIKSGEHYKRCIEPQSTLKKTSCGIVHPITLNIHTDGAPLVRTTKSSLWPCLASIVELPPQVREKQTNILILCLWTSSIKPDVNLFMKECIQQLIDLSAPSTLVINNLQFSISVKTQLFVSDLPAKALFWKTINYNGYNACTNCLTEGTCHNRRVFYPYKKNNYQKRTHAEFVATARAVDDRSSDKRKGGAIDGIKGLSPLLQIFEYPKQIILDYMHLCCLGHTSTLIQRWLMILTAESITEINSNLFSQRFPHNMSVRFNYPLNSCGDWKAKHFRVFVLSIGLPYMLSHLPPIVASHFALYSMFIKLLHCPKSNDEIELADQIIHYYCRTAPVIYGETIELFSLHAHLHLPHQVLTHGGLSFTSAFCFESAIRYLKKKAHGTRILATQIADWINIGTIVKRPPLQLLKPTGINGINIVNHIFDKYRPHFLVGLHSLNYNENEVVVFLRFKMLSITYHTLLYDLPFNCSSYIVSYRSIASSIQYGQVIIFFGYHEDYYAFIQQYESTGKDASDYVTLPEQLEEKLNELFPIRRLSDSYGIIRVTDICHKCIQVAHENHVFLSEIRVDFEHD